MSRREDGLRALGIRPRRIAGAIALVAIAACAIVQANRVAAAGASAAAQNQGWGSQSACEALARTPGGTSAASRCAHLITVDTVGSPASNFILTGDASVVVQGPSQAFLSATAILVNGVDVTASFTPGSAPGTLGGSLSGLNPGANVLEVVGAHGKGAKLAQQTITRSVPMVATCGAFAGQTIPASAIGLPTSGATITSAVIVAAVEQQVISATVTQLATPEYCQVAGAILPVDPGAPQIRFQVDLPMAWNQKLAQMGGSGYNGVIPGSLIGAGMRFGPESLPPDSPYALTRGYVVYGSDSGHQGNAPTWALNAESFQNYAYAQVKKTHDVALLLAMQAYGEITPRHSYYFGTSTGGREGLQAVQRYPQDYDGVLSQVPVVVWAYTGTYDAIFRAQAQTGAGWIPPAKIPAINQEVRRQCDELDGVVDGLVANYETCNRRFDPTITPQPFAAIRCPGGVDTGSACLSDAQLAVLDSYHAPTGFPYALPDGFNPFAGWQVGSEASNNSLYFNTQPNLAATNNASPMLVATVGTTPFNSLLFNPTTYASGVQYVMSTLHPTSPDLSAFKARGGKLLMKSNSADYVANPRIIAQYYQSVVNAMGQSNVDAFLRYYVATGLWHGRNLGFNTVTGAPIPYFVDFIRLVDNWVEDERVPNDQLTVTYQSGLPPFGTTASLPMCRYRQFPLYLGGDQSQASSYSCVYPASGVQNDVNADGVVTCADVAAARDAVGTRRGEPGYLPTADLNGNDRIDAGDISVILNVLPRGTRCNDD